MNAAVIEFELTGGELCLDFVNTLENRLAPAPKELLNGYADLLTWSAQAGALAPKRALARAGAAERRPAEAQAVLEKARVSRETLFALFSSAAAGQRLPERALGALSPDLSRALERLRVVAAPGSAARWSWDDDPAALDAMLWPVLRSAAELLTSPRLRRVRSCADRACGWLFLDGSRNRSRRWCDMAVCGNRDKVRRHRQRVRRTRGADSGRSMRARERD